MTRMRPPVPNIYIYKKIGDLFFFCLIKVTLQRFGTLTPHLKDLTQAHLFQMPAHFCSLQQHTVSIILSFTIILWDKTGTFGSVGTFSSESKGLGWLKI